MEIQFNWVFALVGGFLFLLFFFILIRAVLTSNSDKETRELSFRVQTILSDAAASPDTFAPNQLKDTTYHFTCSNESGKVTESYVRIGEKSYDDQGLRYLPLFSPTTVKGDELFTVTRTWQAPFQISRLIMLSNNRTRYVFFTGTTTKIRELLSQENLQQYGYDIRLATDDYDDAGFDQYRFIYYNTQPNAGTVISNVWNRFKKPGNTALYIDTSDNGESGTLRFYDDLSSISSYQEVHFYGRAMLDAAIFSQDKATFDCNMLKALERLKTVQEILNDRLDKLNLDGNVTGRCKDIYLYARGPIGGVYSAGQVQQPAIKSLIDLNRQALANQCPLIY
jgi:hypothetical protein